MTEIYPLHNAVKENNIDMVYLLLESGYDVDEFDDDDETPLFIVVENQ